MNGIAIRGMGSAIAQRLVKLLPAEERVIEVARDAFPPLVNCERFVFCQGVLRDSKITAQSDDDLAESFQVNAAYTIKACDNILASNPRARICVIGSESGYTWSHDGSYAASKAAVQAYVGAKPLRSPGQQLVAIAPYVVADTEMTRRRADHERLAARVQWCPKRRFLEAVEVARLIHFLLYVDQGYISNTTVRMNGGAHIAGPSAPPKDVVWA